MKIELRRELAGLKEKKKKSFEVKMVYDAVYKVFNIIAEQLVEVPNLVMQESWFNASKEWKILSICEMA